MQDVSLRWLPGLSRSIRPVKSACVGSDHRANGPGVAPPLSTAGLSRSPGVQLSLACLPWVGMSNPVILAGCLLFLLSLLGCLLWLKWKVYKGQRHTVHASIMAVFLALPLVPTHQKVGVSQEVESFLLGSAGGQFLRSGATLRPSTQCTLVPTVHWWGNLGHSASLTPCLLSSQVPSLKRFCLGGDLP